MDNMKYLVISIIAVLLFLIFILAGSHLASKETSTFEYSAQDQSKDLYVIIPGIPGSSGTFSPLIEELENRNMETLIFSLRGLSVQEDLDFVLATLMPLESNLNLIIHDRGGLVGILSANKINYSSITVLNSLIQPGKAPFPQNIFGNALVDVLYSDSFIGSVITKATLAQGGLSEAPKRYIPKNRKHIRSFFKNFNSLSKLQEDISDSLEKNKGIMQIIWGIQDPFLKHQEQLDGLENLPSMLVENASHFIGHTHPALIVDAILEN